MEKSQKTETIESILKKTGLTYNVQQGFFSTIWKISSAKKINVIITGEVHPDWIHILCNIGPMNDFLNLDPKLLLRLNNSIIGCKLAMDRDLNLICSSEIWYDKISEEVLKNQITQVVNMVSLFYNHLEKENLKLDST
ncbi:MAG: type III secretion system chaperone [Candidatus Lokiarchaeota archaeon]|nr:type III secretion system chaperone [Candidatus Lokiarchaeota archaeon]